MKPTSLRPLAVLCVEDSSVDVEMLLRYLRTCGFAPKIRQVYERQSITEALQSQKWDVVLCDHWLPTLDSLEVLQIVRDEHELTDIPFIVVSGELADASVVGVLKAGAQDFVPKSDLSRLAFAIERELREFDLRKAKLEAEGTLAATAKHLRGTLVTLAESQNKLTKLERLKALDQMTSGIAHDFNNELTKMLGIVEILSARLPDEHDSLGQLQTLTADAANVVRRLRDFYQEAPNTEEDCVLIDPAELVEQTATLTKPKWHNEHQAAGAQITLSTKTCKVAPIHVNPSTVREILTNLVFNACDAMPTGGNLTLSTSQESPETVAISVTDTGSGMTSAVRDRCLEPFFSTKGDDGTGLGLGIAQSLTRQCGGDLEIVTEVGTGTTVSLKFPAAKKHQSPLLSALLNQKMGNQMSRFEFFLSMTTPRYQLY